MKKLPSYIILFFITLLACYRGNGLSPNGSDTNISGIEGIITFTGEWPDSTLEVRVAALKKYPAGITDPDSLLLFVLNAYTRGELVFSDTIPRFIKTYDYTLNLQPGKYEWIVVVWFPDIDDYLLGVKELGAYYIDPEDTESPTPVNVMPGVITKGIDITADLENVYRDSPFF